MVIEPGSLIKVVRSSTTLVQIGMIGVVVESEVAIKENGVAAEFTGLFFEHALSDRKKDRTIIAFIQHGDYELYINGEDKRTDN